MTTSAHCSEACQLTVADSCNPADVIAQAQSGTGKTATFSISLLQRIDINVRETQALILSPTRELATQAQSGESASVSAA